MLDIYAYTDYRKFLNDYLCAQRADNRDFTYQKLAKKAGFSSKGYITQVIQGKSNISTAMILKFAEALKLKKKQSEYFELLVHFNQGKTNKEKKHYFEKLISLKQCKIKVVEADRYKFYDKWHHAAIRSLLGYYPFNGDFAELARQLVPPITPSEAKKSINLLEKLKFIEKGPDGYYHLTERIITTGSEHSSIAIANCQLSTMDLAKESLERFPRNQRNASTLTLGLSESGYRQIEERISKFRKDCIEIARFDKRIDRVYQLNLHAFPLTKIRKGGRQ